MKTQDLAILKSLVSVAWADGEYHDSEREMVEALISAFEANETEAQFIREYASEQKTLDDIPLDDLSEADRRLLLQHAVYLTFVDKEQHEAEKKFLEALSTHLGLAEDEARQIREAAEQRAQAHMTML
ncbi:DUF533 domain-containing protein [Chondromyces apiculatus]|uniref:Putative membrane protein n=1 Tax=Chondromyces apiculatus DSM 436 TaxID=1192034 RepID=A0A017TI88_9BACT|nr:DUF533 domain-containing protein [Chondromyces apiculatus]EYF08993.1 putative membrane protein [Chondromyces apiculatus DSM 436]